MVQHPVYYTSRALRGAETRYPWTELLTFALITAAQRLHPYFQAHTIRVLTETPLAKLPRKPDSTGRLIGWSIELSEFDITYEPRKTIKGQALVDFLVEFIDFPEEEAVKLPAEKSWVLFIDSSACRVGGGLRVHLTSLDGQEYFYAATLTFKATNNEVEYEALIAGLGMAAKMGVTEVEVRSDSQVVVNQVMGVYAIKGEKLKKYLECVWQLCDAPNFTPYKKRPN